MIQDLAYSVNYGTVLGIFTFTVMIYLVMLRLLTTRNQKILYTGFVLFYFIYQGYGIGYEVGVYHGYALMYCVFLASLSLAYWFFLLLFKKEVEIAKEGTMGLLKSLFENQVVVVTVIALFLLIWMVRLSYPEFKLPLLFNPPAPDIIGEFIGRYQAPPNAITKLMANATFLLYPFFLIAVMKYRYRPLIFSGIILLPYYFQYCMDSYISRGEVLAALFIVASVLWFYNKKLRRYMVVGLVLVLPFLPTTLMNYQNARLKATTAVEIERKDALNLLVFSETSFPIYSGKVINSGKQIDLKRYFIWIATLPIPKAIIGSVNAPSAGMEMSEILLDKKQGRKDFYALLAGLLTESAYIYGTRFFFLHAVFIAAVMAFITRLTEHKDLLFCVFIVLVMHLTYRLNRAGIAAVLAVVINMYISLYALFFLGYLKRRIRLA